MLRKRLHWSTSSIGAAIFVRSPSGSILKSKTGLGYADLAKRPHRLKGFGGKMRRTFLMLVYLVFMVGSRGNVFAQDSSQPLRVAIVGLEHGHVSGFLKQFPKQNEVQLVGIVDADALPTSEKLSPAAPSTFAVAALVVRFCFEACLTRDMVASSVSSCEIARQASTRRNRRARLTTAIKRDTSHRVPFIFMNEIDT